MRRSLAGFGIAAVLVVAACTDSPQGRQPLAPTEPSLAQGDLCSGGLASQIAKEQKALFAGTQLTDLQNQFTAIKSACPGSTTFALMMNYIETVIAYRGTTISQPRAEGFVNHWNSIALYSTGNGLVRPYTVLMNTGGAAVLEAGESMTTYDKGAQLIAGGAAGSPHLYTFEPKPSSFCGGITTLRVTGGGNSSLRGAGADCYDLRDYPHETSYSPPATLTLCLRGAHGPAGIIHERANYGGEVLPEVEVVYSCSEFHASANSLFRRDGNPVERVLARAYDFLRPQPLFADDAGESGGLGLFSFVGGALTVVYQDGFTANDIGPLANNTDPEVGDFPSSWLVEVNHPGYVQIQNGVGDLTGKVVTISQALGNCAQCPTVKLLGTRVNPSATDNIGSYEISWQQLQVRGSVKEAPFVVLSHTGAELARLSFLTESGSNVLKYNNTVVGTWTKEQHKNFRIRVNLNTLNDQNEFTTTLWINDVAVATNVPFVTLGETTVSTFGYVLGGIDAGIIGADNFLMKRLPDQP